MDPLLEETLQFLNSTRMRATYGAVAQLLGVEPISMGARLGPHRPEASWIVSAESGLPTGYGPNETHPDLLSNPDILREGTDLLQRLNGWRTSRNDKPNGPTPQNVNRPPLFIVGA